jgi:PAS domain S-box-containing protein
MSMTRMDHGLGASSAPQLLQAYERAIDENIISSITDVAGVILHVNERFCETSRYAPAELVGKNHRIVNSGTHPKEFFAALWRTIGRGAVWHGEIRNRAKDGTFYWVDSVIVPIKDIAGTITQYLSLRTLITERKELERKKEEHLGALETLLVMTARNIREPLSACLKHVDRIDSGRGMNAGELRAAADTMKENVRQLDAFTRELGTFIRDMGV